MFVMLSVDSLEPAAEPNVSLSKYNLHRTSMNPVHIAHDCPRCQIPVTSSFMHGLCCPHSASEQHVDMNDGWKLASVQGHRQHSSSSSISTVGELSVVSH
jgi:hypothetical protein